MKNKFITNIPDYEGIGVYALINDRNGKMYIGSSQNIHQRIIQQRNSPPSAMIEDIQNGDTFSVKILEKLSYGCNQFDMFGREAFFIQYHDTLNKGYNKAITTCSTKDELLLSLEHFKNNSEMSEYIKNIIAKREKPIYAKKQPRKGKMYHLSIKPSLYSIVQAHATSTGESMNAFVSRAITETMERDNQKGK